MAEQKAVSRRYWWFAEHALHEGGPVPIPAVDWPNPSIRANSLVIKQQPGVYRSEILCPLTAGRNPRTGAPIATVYSFHFGAQPIGDLKRAWHSAQEHYCARFRIELPADDAFICVIRHKHLLELDAQLEAAVTEICDAVGYGGLLHSMGIKPPNEAIFPYIATLPSTASVIGHLLRVGRAAH